MTAALLACSRAAEPTSPSPPPRRDAGVAHVPDAPRAGALARWSNIAVVEGCFYFSGPFNGRDELLRGEAIIRVDGERVHLTLGPATFEGTLRDDLVELVRTTAREHEGTWTVTETIAGTYHDGILHATYRYEECIPREPCPGRCTMTADLIAR